MLYVLYALLAGAASAFAFQPVGLWPLLLVAFALLCEFLCRSKSMGSALLIGWAFGLGQFVIGLNWIATAFTFQSNMPAWLGWVAVLLLSLYLAVYPALAAGLAWRFGREDRAVLVIVLGGAWAITEWLRGGMFTGFPWNPAAAALASTPLIRTTPLIGSYGLSGLAVMLGGAIWLEYHRKWLPLVVIVGATILLCVLPSSSVPADPLAVVDVRVIQPNIGQEDKWRPGFGEEAARRLAMLSGPPSAEPRLLLWPEAAVTEPLDDARTDEHQTFADFQRTRAASLLGPNDRLLTGGIAIASKDGVHVDGAANSVFALAPGGKVLGRYDKAHLVPYGEYLPMRPLLSAIGLSRLAPGDLDFTSGPGPRTIDIGGEWGKIGFELCYEIIFSGHVVDEKHRPAFIFNPSNDAWFGRWGPPQHLAQARLRAAEEGLPVLRSTPTGISAVIDARGQVVKSLPWRTAGVIDAVLPPAANSPPPFARFGNVIPLLLGLALIVGGIVLGRRRR
ncbi:apolipoprotein N-acyltransferase [Sphingomonas sp.]|uniref:apolipoprotein N-acyltransferase n=1 Tax=Sphingomonas sp. TaxID=28214 RepID=UPI0038A89996